MGKQNCAPGLARTIKQETGHPSPDFVLTMIRIVSQGRNEGMDMDRKHPTATKCTARYLNYDFVNISGLKRDHSSMKVTLMVSAISSSATSILSSTSSSSSASDLASLEAQLAEKQAALSETDDEEEKATIEKAIATLQSKIAKISVTESSDTQTTTSTKTEEEAPQEMSGESERIGTKNFDEDSAFGDRTAYV
ncbi:hypothetical protein [Rhizobium sp. 18065]|uniref:hypothetical protein n=1 Tax=Rhizobium sp. 18065 TaxID=2681411 RepID=UPI001FCE64B6|nr:hypothetical protein [Rhizobium sp. 18065]